MTLHFRFGAPPDYLERCIFLRRRLSETQAALGNAIHALNLAANTFEKNGEDASIYRETVAEIMPLRHAR